MRSNLSSLQSQYNIKLISIFYIKKSVCSQKRTFHCLKDHLYEIIPTVNYDIDSINILNGIKMKRKLLFCAFITYSVLNVAQAAKTNGLDLGPLSSLIGTWKSAEMGGVDIAPGQTQSAVGKGGRSS